MVNTRPVVSRRLFLGANDLAHRPAKSMDFIFLPRASGIYNAPENQKEVPLNLLVLLLFLRMREEQRVGKSLGLKSEALGLCALPLTNPAILGKLLHHAEFRSPHLEKQVDNNNNFSLTELIRILNGKKVDVKSTS